MFKSAKTFVLLAAFSGLLLLIGQVLGQTTGLYIALGIALVMNVGSYWFSDRLAIKMAQAYEVQPGEFADYVQIVTDLSMRTGKPMPRLYMSPSPQLNAFATGRNPEHAAVCVNQGLYDALTHEELEGVLAHELSHVYNRDILIGTIAAVLATTVTFLARFALYFGGGRGRDRGGNPIAQIALVILAPVAAMVIRAAITRSREQEADVSGAHMTGNPLGLARALAKLEAGGNDPRLLRAGGSRAETNEAMSHMFIASPFGGRLRMSKMFSSHPPIPDRIAALEEMAREMGQLGPQDSWG